jgi:hypothetical protein
MKTILTISLACLFLAGCASTRPILDVAAAGGGAAIANELSDGDPVVTAAGAAGGVLLSEGLHYAARRQSEKAYRTGYEKGRSDAVKQQYWILVNQQRVPLGGSANVRLYEIPLPEQTIDGVILKPTTKYLRIEE